MIKKLLFFLLFFISSICHTNSFILWSQQSWLEKLWEFFIKPKSIDSKIEEKIKAKQEAMINQLHNEYEHTLNQMAKDLGMSDYDWQEFLKRRAEKKEEFLKSLGISREDCYHDPLLSKKDKALFIDACKIYSFNPEAIDIKFENLDKLVNAEAKIINHCPTVIVDKRYWNSTSEDRKFHTLLHELGHLMEGHYVTEEILCANLGANLGLYNRLRMTIMTMLFSEKITVSYMQHKEAIAELLGDCTSKKHNKLMLDKIRADNKNEKIEIIIEVMIEDIFVTKNLEAIQLYQKKIKELIGSDPTHLNYLEQLYLRRLIYHRLYATEKEKTIEDIIKYNKRCNEAPLIKSTFNARAAAKN